MTPEVSDILIKDRMKAAKMWAFLLQVVTVIKNIYYQVVVKINLQSSTSTSNIT